MNDANRYRTDPCPPCPPFWHSRRTYTARCPAGMTGEAVTTTREYRSTISQKDADHHALRLAREDATKQLTCKWVYKACQRTHCLLTVGNVVSNFDDHFTLEYLHDPPLPPEIGDTIELVSPDHTFFGMFEVKDVFEVLTIFIEPSPGVTIPVGTAVKLRPNVCCEKSSTVSADHAQNLATACVHAQIDNLCNYGDLLPIGSTFL